MSQSEVKNVCKVKQTLKWSCGDRYTTFKQSDAVEHVRDTGHTMDVKGILSPEKELTRKRKAKLNHRRDLHG